MIKDSNKFKNFLIRNISIFSDKSYIYGSIHSGKTCLALHHAQKFHNVKYINLDMLISIESKNKELENLKLNKYDLVIIDNFKANFLGNLKLDSKCIFIGDYENAPKDFDKICLLGLSFEEFLSFDKKNTSIESNLANFIKQGNNIELLFVDDFKKTQRKWDILKCALQRDFFIFYYMLALQGQKTSTYGIYKFLKKNIKVSKDRIYELITFWQKNCVIFTCEHIDNFTQNGNKNFKLYFCDFSLSEFCENKRFSAIFENMVFLELISMGFNLVYSELCDFIDTESGYIFLSTPFASIDMIKSRVAAIKSAFRKANNKLDSKKPTTKNLESLENAVSLENEVSLASLESTQALQNFTIIAITMNLNHTIDSKTNIIEFANLSLILNT
ncbi:ATP-binding protein [Helicobacter saguini]|uniref:ATP-binding protein n=1 Tax=Helicobacter saguini TaxID=1548018 RepID=A0A347VHG2_9HELI|nr:ATP-binding protein [Helicobacter saguini]MWV62276.1 ATP-binding protein [Helicobacter saguini]MWV67051.1 ATP-binding protein [Helicobacter saguini]MWV69401.1 ATP-binding protein [Helicobacter saguini]MWV71045.1 ATP-binding protein [Helicobacter saguini]TLD95049.1 ATP-binding protein [Helicobacter saguini]